MLFSFSQPLKSPCSIAVRLLGSVIFSRALQPKKTNPCSAVPSCFTLSGSVTLFSFSQPAKALPPMAVTPCGIVTLSTLLPANSASASFVTFMPSSVCGMLILAELLLQPVTSAVESSSSLYSQSPLVCAPALIENTSAFVRGSAESGQSSSPTAAASEINLFKTNTPIYQHIIMIISIRMVSLPFSLR